jgi:hypothetical protein
MDAIRELRNVRPQFDPAAFRPLAEKLKFFETLPESRVEELSFARYAVVAPLAAVLGEPVKAVDAQP